MRLKSKRPFELKSHLLVFGFGLYHHKTMIKAEKVRRQRQGIIILKNDSAGKREIEKYCLQN